ncbi:MAG TPA: DUF599 family protein [Xanthobacteraceae bacterium]|jgi:uncharacterized membrane protein|nr:DUF599 family protein [Xanthobacteraceae bacterium]
MYVLSLLDWFAIAWFVLAWAGYSVMMEMTPVGAGGLNASMNRYRSGWMQEMVQRDNRIMDGQIMASLQNGTAFFASTSLLAVGGALALLRSAPDVAQMYTQLPFAEKPSAGLLEIKTGGLLVIFIYAFFKFAWSYRLFNYAAILLGSTPPRDHKDKRGTKAAVERLARMVTIAGRHFNRGQRAFFFALGYLGWFISPWALIATTAAVLVVTVIRQFGPAARWVIHSGHN